MTSTHTEQQPHPAALMPAAAARVGDVIAAIAGGEPDRWDAQSPCTRWTVRDVLNHLTSEHLWAPHLLRGETLEQVGDRYDGDVLGADPVAAWISAITASLLAWADATSGTGDSDGRNGQPDQCGEVHTSMGMLPVTEYAHQMLVDLTVHGWDLAHGAGVPYEPHDDAVAVCLAYEEPRVGDSGVAGIFRPAVPASSDRPFDRLLALLGRDAG